MPDLAAEAAARPRTRVDVVDLLTAMLAVPSVSGDEDALSAMLVWRLLDAGFDVDVDAVGNVIAAWGDGPETIALVGHVDTVPGHIEARRDGGVLHGRGAVDAKGPLAAAIAAVSRQPRDGGRRFVVVGAVQEETTSRGAHHLATSMAAPHGLVILEPSGSDAVTIGYKGSLRLRASFAQPQAHSAGREPSAADRCIDVVRALQDCARAPSRDAGVFDRVDVRVLRVGSEHDGLVDRATVDIGLRNPARLRCWRAARHRSIHWWQRRGHSAQSNAGGAHPARQPARTRTDPSDPRRRRCAALQAQDGHVGPQRARARVGVSCGRVRARRFRARPHPRGTRVDRRTRARRGRARARPG
ncbi:MAG TPA: M20/M25/M40 family metallo-hydrolase [Candidatus Dormibacteraeota bacterium]